MKAGKTLSELAAEVTRQQSHKIDFVADTRQLRLETDPDGSCIHGIAQGAVGQYDLTENAHRQIAARADIPRRYYDRIRSQHPGLLDTTINTIWDGEPERRMVRTLDGEARAFLSDRYRRLDNADVLEQVLPVLAESELELASCEITESRLYLKVRFPLLQQELNAPTGNGHGAGRGGDLVESAITISNSEVGLGSLSVTPAVYTHACTNMMMIKSASVKKYHLGRAGDDGVQQVLTEETRRADDRALWLRLRDVVRASMSREWFFETIQKMNAAQADKIENDPVAAVEVLQSRASLTDGERSSVLVNLINGGDLSRLGLLNAVTRSAESAADYDRATELEGLGGDILTLDRSAWREIAAKN